MEKTDPRNSSGGSVPFRKILIGLDLSEQTDVIIEKSAKLAGTSKASVEIVTVVNVPTNSAGNELDGSPANDEEIRLRDYLISRLHRYFGDEVKNLEVKVLHGDPAERLSEYAEYSNCDLIVVGSRSRGALRKAILGSVSGSVAAKSKTSVVIVK